VEAQADYHVGAGDQLNVYVWNHPELTLTVPVRPDGKISTPLIESLPAAGKTPTELAREMEAALSEYVRSPKVNVIVTGFVGDLPDQVRVIGQAAKPQSLPYRANMTVLDVLIASGGLAPFAAGNRAHIVRMVDGKSIKIKVRLADIAEKGDLQTNVAVRPGDVIVIPESRF
jgi:polysaccharide export outer membrane protein